MSQLGKSGKDFVGLILDLYNGKLGSIITTEINKSANFHT